MKFVRVFNYVYELLREEEFDWIRFNILAVIKNRKEVYTAKIKELQKKRLDIIRADKLESVAALNRTVSEINADIAAASEKIMSEEEKFEKWRIENIR
ncbi:hypothetical protein QQ045_002906 [Rhodiola kirilowii]